MVTTGRYVSVYIPSVCPFKASLDGTSNADADHCRREDAACTGTGKCIHQPQQQQKQQLVVAVVHSGSTAASCRRAKTSKDK